METLMRLVWQVAKTLWQTPRLSILKLFNENQGVFALNVLEVLKDPIWVERLTKSMRQISELDLHAHVSKSFPASDVASAHKFLESRSATGKVLISWN